MRFGRFLVCLAVVAFSACAGNGAEGPPVAQQTAALRAGAPAPAVVKTTLYSFTGGHDGALPVGGLTWDGRSHFWGATEAGGTQSCGCGVVFAVNPNDPSHLELYQFNGGPDGAFPQAAPIIVGNRIVGTTTQGGGSCPERPNGCGTVWVLNADGSEQIVHAFKGPDGVEPMAIQDNLPGRPRDATQFVGVAKYGGTDRSCRDGCGTSFGAYADGSKFTADSLIGRFGGHPVAAPVWNNYLRTFLATATDGGGTDCPRGCGTLLQDLPGAGVVPIDNFRNDLGYDAAGGVTNDIGPERQFGSIVYGTTAQGASPSCSCGSIYTIQLAYMPGKPDGYRKIHVEHTFEGGSDGANPSSPLVAGNGVYYGTTLHGGNPNCYGGCGTVFEFNPVSKAYRVVYRFAGGADGAYPSGLAYLNGTVYGVAANGGAYGHGVIFSLQP